MLKIEVFQNTFTTLLRNHFLLIWKFSVLSKAKAKI